MLPGAKMSIRAAVSAGRSGVLLARELSKQTCAQRVCADFSAKGTGGQRAGEMLRARAE